MYILSRGSDSRGHTHDVEAFTQQRTLPLDQIVACAAGCSNRKIIRWAPFRGLYSALRSLQETLARRFVIDPLVAIPKLQQRTSALLQRRS